VAILIFLKKIVKKLKKIKKTKKPCADT